jgi:hypothetical protein
MTKIEMEWFVTTGEFCSGAPSAAIEDGWRRRARVRAVGITPGLNSVTGDPTSQGS